MFPNLLDVTEHLIVKFQSFLGYSQRLEVAKFHFSTSKRVFPYYQGESTIFDKGNYLYHTPDSNKIMNLRELYFSTHLWVDQKKRAHTKIIQ